jgi:hypothetical protein
MQPEVWKHYAPTNADWKKPEDSLLVAKAIMQERCAVFERSEKRPPTDFEFYVLWNAPAQVKKPSKAVARRAERFCNVVNLQPPPSPDPKAKEEHSVTPDTDSRNSSMGQAEKRIDQAQQPQHD